MTDRYEKIRKALEMGPTPGPWLVCPTNSGTFVKSERVSGYLAEVRHCRTTQDVKADAHLIAACYPDTIRALFAERDQLAAENERLSRYYKNGILCFANPCERHSGERTPPADEFAEKYGWRCLICVVDNNNAIQAENKLLRAEVDALAAKVASYARAEREINEALNMGNGSYLP